MDILKFKKLEQLVDKVYSSNKPYLSKFLDESEVQYLSKFNKINIEFYGGFTHSKKNRAFLSPKEFEVKSNFNLTVFKVVYNKKFTTIEHKHVLGTIMALGIARDVIGDIVVDNDIYFAVTNEIKEFVVQNLKVINRASVSLEETNDSIEIKENFIEREITASSLRIDLVVSNVYNFSRNQINDFFDQDYILLNNDIVNKSFKTVNINDIIICRKKGKFKIVNIINSSRNNKHKILIHIYN
ncbi:MAG: YlmH/Sll1252 family protein [bacterium]